MTWTMFDSISASSFPAGGFDATAGYLPGSGWPSSAAIRKRFPDKPHLTITTKAAYAAMCLDVEPRAATPAQAPGWFDRADTGPVVYYMASWGAQVRAAMGSRDYIRWSAHYTGHPHICGPGQCGYPQADGTQWIDHGPGGENVDQSLINERFWKALGGQGGTVEPAKPSIVGAGVPVLMAAGTLTVMG
jgi:hypothetical protein